MPHLDTDLMAEAADLGEATMAQKRAAVAGLVAEVLATHDATSGGGKAGSAWVVDETVRQAMLDGADRRDRLRLMGHPARYAVVEWLGRVQAPDGVNRTGAVPAHQFAVTVWVGFVDGQSQALFDAVAEAAGPAAPGLLPTFAVTSALLVGDAVVELGQPADVETTLDVLSFEGEFAHSLFFTVTTR